MPTLFLPQTQLEEWVVAEKADMRDNQLVFPGEAKSLPLTSAVHFARLVTGSDDRKLINKVKTDAQLAELGAEQMSDSVILGETAYEVVIGYLLQVAGGGTSTGKPGSPDSRLLADFLLNKLS